MSKMLVISLEEGTKVKVWEKNVLFTSRGIEKQNLKGITATKISSYTFLPVSGHHCFLTQCWYVCLQVYVYEYVHT